jgi:hypothetical protein
MGRPWGIVEGKSTIKGAKGAHLEGKIRNPNSVLFLPNSGNSQQNQKILWKLAHNPRKIYQI